MPTEIKQLKENGVEFYPVTVGEAVMIDNNTTVSSKINSIESNSGNPVKYVAQSLTEEQQMQARKNQGLYYTEEGEGEATLTFDGDLTNATLMYEYSAYAENNINVEEMFDGQAVLFAKISDKVAENILAARMDWEDDGESVSEEMPIDRVSKIECDNYYYISFDSEDYGIMSSGYIVVVQEDNTTVSVIKEDGTDVMSISGVDKGIYVAVMNTVENSQLTPMAHVSSVTYFGEAEIDHKIPTKYIDSNINIEGIVKYNTSQNLTDEQKATARKNQGLYTDEILSFETGIDWDAETISAESVIVYNKNYTQWQFYKVGELNNVNMDLLLNPELKSVFTINNSNYENLNLNTAKKSFTNWEWTIEGGTCVMFGTSGDTEYSYWYVFIADNFELSKEGSNLTLNGIYCTYGVNSFKILYPINKIDKKYLNIDVYEERSLPEEGMLPNTPYNLGVIVDDTSFILEKGIDGLFNHYFWTFDIKNIVPEITWPNYILWDDGEIPTIEPYKHYEISVYNNIAMYAVIDLPEPDLSTPLSFDILSNGTVIWNGYGLGYGNTIEYSKDRGITWNSITYSQNHPVNIDVKKGDTISFRGDNVGYANPQQQTVRNYFNIYATCIVYGNIMSLIDSSNFSTLKTISSDWAFWELFMRNDDIIDASKLLLPATTLSVGCYAEMFRLCSYLITPPELPATTLTEKCYDGMFNNCLRLTSAPELPAINLAAQCYKQMFNHCENLTTAPELPVLTLYANCYESMFSNCTKLTKAPDLLALSGTGNQNTACYRQMFYGCTRLREARCLMTSANDMYQMFSMCSSTGTLIKHPNVTLLASTVPNTWTVIDDTSVDIPT